MIGLHEGKGSPLKKKPADRVIALRLNVVACRPLIWRRLLVRESMWLSRLHDSLQVAFDWFDYQTHAFNLDDLRFGNPLKRDELSIEDDRDVTLADLDLEHRERFSYGYHFPRAGLMPGEDGPRGWWLVNGDKYSVSTSRLNATQVAQT